MEHPHLDIQQTKGRKMDPRLLPPCWIHKQNSSLLVDVSPDPCEDFGHGTQAVELFIMNAQGIMGIPSERMVLSTGLSVLLSVWVLLLCAGPGPRGVFGAGLVRKKPPVRRGCLPLPEEILEQMYGRLTVGIMSAFHHALQLQQNPDEQRNSSCPSAAWASAASGSPLPVNLLSISPWAYRMSHEPSRYPRSIPEAYCLCRGCLIGPYGQESADFQSVPVFAPAVVLRRSGPCVSGRYIYSEHYISLAVGCTCVPMMEPQDNTI